MTAPPSSSAAGLGPAGRDAETTTGPPEGTWALVGGHAITVAEALADRDRARRVAADLTDALTALTHGFEPIEDSDSKRCGYIGSPHGWCAQFVADPVHRTPARVRAQLEERQP